VGKSSGVIDINGNQYNAITGQLVGSAKQVIQKAKSSNSFQSIDGFVRKSVTKSDLSAPIKKIRSTSALKVDAKKVHQGTQKAETLMRGAVKKPAIPKPSPANRAQKAKTGKVLSIEPTRARRARETSKHTKISRFGQPKAAVEPEIVQKPNKLNAPGRSTAQTQTPSAAAKAVAMPSMVTSVSHQHLERLLDQALFRADAHKQALKGRSPNQNLWQKARFAPRWVSAMCILLVLAVIGAFFAWQNIPQFSMKIAANKAHIAASIPAYSPSGFKFSGPISSSKGEVTMKFTANGDTGRNFSISQKNTSWDSASLLANYVNPVHHNYQTSQVKGTTLYMYGDKNNATWVSNGIWYTINDEANLNSDQLMKIADSM
jgi:hypothetical protein